MGDLSKNFSKSEFYCKCGDCPPDSPHPRLVLLLQKIRDNTGQSLRINSGIRCHAHNQSVGGSRNSYHIPRSGYGMAADITFTKGSLRTPENMMRLYVLADKYDARGIGLYHNRIHVDVRLNHTRWIDKTWEWSSLE